MPSVISLLDVKKYYLNLPHQQIALEFLHSILLGTPAKERLNLTTNFNSLLGLSEESLIWLQKQIESTQTLDKFAKLWRSKSISTRINSSNPLVAKLFSQRDNSILPFTTCASSSSAAYCDYQLRKAGKTGLQNDEGYLGRVFSGKYGVHGGNSSVSWDIQTKVLNSYGVKSDYKWTGELSALCKEVDLNGCSVVNIFHRGESRQTKSGGHIVLVTKINPDGSVKVHDPYGERPPSYNLVNVGKVQSNLTSSPVFNSELETLQKIILCEARGEGLLGMALVARVILNRLNLTEIRIENFGTPRATIKDIVYSKHQFEPVTSNSNNISTILKRTTPAIQKLSIDAIELAQNLPLFISKLSYLGVKNPEQIVKSTFFATQKSVNAIAPYAIKLQPFANHVFGATEKGLKVPDSTLFKPYPGLKTPSFNNTVDLVGVYTMSAEEFSWRWQGCYRYLL